MGTVAFAVPITKGQADHLFDHVGHVTGGGQTEHHEHNTRRGLTHIRLYHQTEPAEMLIVYLEGPNVEKSLEEMLQAPEAWEQRWLKLMDNLGGHQPHHFSASGSKLVMDWHHEEGHKPKAAGHK